MKLTEKQIEIKKLLSDTKIAIQTLAEVGEDYSHFQSAQYAHKSFKKMQKLISHIT